MDTIRLSRVVAPAEISVSYTEKTEDPSITRFSTFMMRKFLFVMRLNPSDVEQGRLFVPVEIALDDFPPLLPKRNPTYEEKIKVSNIQNRHWFMTVTYDSDECGFLINSVWQRFSGINNFKVEDVICLQTFPVCTRQSFLGYRFQRKSGNRWCS